MKGISRRTLCLLNERSNSSVQEYNLRNIKHFKVTEFNLPSLNKKKGIRKNTKSTVRYSHSVCLQKYNPIRSIKQRSEVPNSELEISFIMNKPFDKSTIKAWRCKADWLHRMRTLGLGNVLTDNL